MLSIQWKTETQTSWMNWQGTIAGKCHTRPEEGPGGQCVPDSVLGISTSTISFYRWETEARGSVIASHRASKW